LGPLEGARVLDFSQFMAGPVAAQKLGDLGAEVIKVEKPQGGDASRYASASPFSIAGERVAFVALNRNKRSITLDLKNEKGLEICLRLIKRADVLIENFRPGVMDRLGLGYSTVSAVNPKIVYGSITGYGPDGPYRDFPGQDLLVQCLSGIVHLNGRFDDPPIAVGMPIIDAIAGQQLAFGIVSALFRREKTGEGQKVSTSLLDVAIDLQAQEFTGYLNNQIEPRRSVAGIAHPFFVPPYGIYATKDGYLALAHTPISRLAEYLNLPELNDLPGGMQAFEKRDKVYKLVASALLSRTTKEWIDYLRQHDFWCGPVQSYKELAEDEQVLHNQMIVELPSKDGQTIRYAGLPLKFSGTPGSICRLPPTLGEHTVEILTELGFSMKQISELSEGGVT
jgi:crotonobetainyl-CoA:carnitine CoA-transferase CaiB-like acyl-CoA transferase